jgi:hypothetical protein
MNLFFSLFKNKNSNLMSNRTPRTPKISPDKYLRKISPKAEKRREQFLEYYKKNKHAFYRFLNENPEGRDASKSMHNFMVWDVKYHMGGPFSKMKEDTRLKYMLEPFELKKKKLTPQDKARRATAMQDHIDKYWKAFVHYQKTSTDPITNRDINQKQFWLWDQTVNGYNGFRMDDSQSCHVISKARNEPYEKRQKEIIKEGVKELKSRMPIIPKTPSKPVPAQMPGKKILFA